MSGVTWSKFYWSDWESDEALKMCSPGAQALWMRMLCVCAKADGYLVIAGAALTADDMARSTGWPAADVRKWWAELKRWKVFSTTGRGKVYCRRMEKDARRSEIARENGSKGGNPSLTKQTGNSPQDNPHPNQAPNPRQTKTPGTRARLNHLPEEPVDRPPKAPQGAFSPSEIDRWFDVAWKAFPEEGTATTNREFSLAAWRPEAARVGPEPLAAAVAAFAKSPVVVGPKAKTVPNFAAWLRNRRFETFLSALDAEAITWTGPEEVWLLAADRMGPPLARSYFRRAAWKDGALYVTGPTAEKAIRDAIGPDLLAMNIPLIEGAPPTFAPQETAA